MRPAEGSVDTPDGIWVWVRMAATREASCWPSVWAAVRLLGSRLCRSVQRSFSGAWEPMVAMAACF